MYAKLLRQVRNSLTPENWHKGSYFSQKENKLCMCVHGAAQTLVNPQVKIALAAKAAATDVDALARARRLALRRQPATISPNPILFMRHGNIAISIPNT